jgi:endonuclease/exonuclease/phosphatase family metal-dependent hydrolase
MKILIYNIAYSTGLKGSLLGYLMNFWRYLVWAPRKTFLSLAEFLGVQDSDIICLLETDVGSLRNRFTNQVRSLAERLSLPFWWTASKYGPRALQNLIPTLRKQHDAVLSRIEGEMRLHHLKSGIKRLVQEFVVKGISLFVVHLALRRSVREKQLKELTIIVKQCPRPFLVCGDFNIFKGLNEVQEFIRENHLNLVQTQASFPSIKPRVLVDLILAREDIKVKDVGVVDVLFSDHLPVWVEINTD